MFIYVLLNKYIKFDMDNITYKNPLYDEQCKFIDMVANFIINIKQKLKTKHHKVYGEYLSELSKFMEISTNFLSNNIKKTMDEDSDNEECYEVDNGSDDDIDAISNYSLEYETNDKPPHVVLCEQFVSEFDKQSEKALDEVKNNIFLNIEKKYAN